MTEEETIRNMCIDLYRKYTHDWPENAFLLVRRSKIDNIQKCIKLIDYLRTKITSIKKIAICHTSDPTPFIYLLKKHYSCEIIVLTDHPIFPRLLPYYNKSFGEIKYVKTNCMFENFSNQIADCDMVFFPEMEYYVPLKLIKTYNLNKLTLCLYYIEDFSSPYDLDLVLCKEDMEEWCSFTNKIDVGQIQIENNKQFFYGLGII